MESRPVSRAAKPAGSLYGVPPITWRQLLACVAIIAGTLSFTGIPASATPTTIRLITRGQLTVHRAARELPNASAPGGEGNAIDTYTGTFALSATDFPTLPVTQPYEFALTGTLNVGDNVYVFDNTSLPPASAARANALATDFSAFQSAPSGSFFPDFLPETTYRLGEGSITILAMADLATVFPDVGPFSALYTDGTYAVSTDGLTLVATPQEEAVPEPASVALLGSALLGLGLIRRKTRRA